MDDHTIYLEAMKALHRGEPIPDTPELRAALFSMFEWQGLMQLSREPEPAMWREVANQLRNTIPKDVRRIVAEDLWGYRLVMITSEPGHGRNVALKKALESQYPGRHVVIQGMGVNYDHELITVADEIEHADVVCIDGFAHTNPNVRATLMELISSGRTHELPVNFQSPRSIHVCPETVFILSEQNTWGDEVQRQIEPCFSFPSRHNFCRWDL